MSPPIKNVPVEADIPEELEAARDYFDSHDLSELMAGGVVVVTSGR